MTLLKIWIKTPEFLTQWFGCLNTVLIYAIKHLASPQCSDVMQYAVSLSDMPSLWILGKR